MSDSSAWQEKLAVWVVVVARIAAAVKFLASFCAYKKIGLKGGGSLVPLDPS